MVDTSFADLAVTLTGHVATVEIQRPPANYFDLALIDALASAYEYLEDEPDCRAIVLGSDGRHFCAGANFGDSTADDADPVGTDALYARSLTLFSLSKPVVAAVQGGAVGGGAGLALSADFRVGDPSSWFAFNFARLGIHQGFGISATLPRVVGQQKALELLYTARRIKGPTGWPSRVPSGPPLRSWPPRSPPPRRWPSSGSAAPCGRRWSRRSGPRTRWRPSVSASCSAPAISAAASTPPPSAKIRFSRATDRSPSFVLKYRPVTPGAWEAAHAAVRTSP